MPQQCFHSTDSDRQMPVICYPIFEEKKEKERKGKAGQKKSQNRRKIEKDVKNQNIFSQNDIIFKILVVLST